MREHKNKLLNYICTALLTVSLFLVGSKSAIASAQENTSTSTESNNPLSQTVLIALAPLIYGFYESSGPLPQGVTRSQQIKSSLEYNLGRLLDTVVYTSSAIGLGPIVEPLRPKCDNHTC